MNKDESIIGSIDVGEAERAFAGRIQDTIKAMHQHLEKLEDAVILYAEGKEDYLVVRCLEKDSLDDLQTISGCLHSLSFLLQVEKLLKEGSTDEDATCDT